MASSSSATGFAAWRQSVVKWAISQFSAAQWETLSLVFHWDDLHTLQHSLQDCRQQRIVLMQDCFADLDDLTDPYDHALRTR
jgi:hypothetical protein